MQLRESTPLELPPAGSYMGLVMEWINWDVDPESPYPDGEAQGCIVFRLPVDRKEGEYAGTPHEVRLWHGLNMVSKGGKKLAAGQLRKAGRLLQELRGVNMMDVSNREKYGDTDDLIGQLCRVHITIDQENQKVIVVPSFVGTQEPRQEAREMISGILASPEDWDDPEKLHDLDALWGKQAASEVQKLLFHGKQQLNPKFIGDTSLVGGSAYLEVDDYTPIPLREGAKARLKAQIRNPQDVEV